MRQDLLDPSKTKNDVILLLKDIILDFSIPFEFTMIKTGHHDDGPHGHFGGFAADGWPLATNREGDYAPSTGQTMDKFLKVAAASKYLRQFGLGGTSFLPHNVALASTQRGVYVFQDGNQDHIHLGAIFN